MENSVLLWRNLPYFEVTSELLCSLPNGLLEISAYKAEYIFIKRSLIPHDEPLVPATAVGGAGARAPLAHRVS